MRISRSVKPASLKTSSGITTGIVSPPSTRSPSAQPLYARLASVHNTSAKPETAKKAIRAGLEGELSATRVAREAVRLSEQEYDRDELIAMLEKEMLEAAESLEFERAAKLRDRLKELKSAPEFTPMMAAAGARASSPAGTITSPRRRRPNGDSDGTWKPKSQHRRK